MLFRAFTVALVGSAVFCGHTSARILMRDVVDEMIPRDYRDLDYRHVHRRGGDLSGRQAAATNCLDPESVQTGSASTGQAATADPGQVNSETDTANFINFCKGQTLTNGLQVKTGSCNGIVMGKIPSTSNMISSVIISPRPGEDLAAFTTFNISVQTKGLAAGSFTNAKLTYYSAPQDLNSQGQIVGHTHVTVQDLGNSLTPHTAPDPTTFAFFKGINDVGNGNGLLSATVTGGLPAGHYRVCTMSSASNHQPVLMPVAQRGAQDDCTKFTVGHGGKGGAAASTASAAPANSTDAASSAAPVSSTDAASSAAPVSSTDAASSAAPASSTDAASSAAPASSTDAASSAAPASSTDAASSAAPAATTAAGGAGGKGGKGGQGAKGVKDAKGGAGGAGSGVSATTTTEAANSSASASVTSTVKVNSGTLGGAAPEVTATGDPDRPFGVNGNTFVQASAAVQRACDIQFNTCAAAANCGLLDGKTVGDCQTQKNSCTQG